MRKRVQIAIVVLLVALGFGVVRLALLDPDQEPVYQGKTLSEWLEGCDKSHWVGTKWRESTEAVRQIGTNAIPTLLRKLRQKDSALTLKLRSWALRQHFIRIRLRYGLEAKQAIPWVVVCLNDYFTDVQEQAADILGRFGIDAKPVCPALVQLLYSPKDGVRLHAWNALKQIDPEAAGRAGVLSP
jgi:HEAT repeat protein